MNIIKTINEEVKQFLNQNKIDDLDIVLNEISNIIDEFDSEYPTNDDVTYDSYYSPLPDYGDRIRNISEITQ